ncbi:hypothetical protein HW555_009431 [Spodoptera exigua]|uniref:Uncharacterized protein n=1 Tax=Spodoptera exigua TaxID=7107 RepID=A0A835G984_SPOEX|nr:hypothetical protein HW555_009431 [Spodoptera exigua]
MDALYEDLSNYEDVNAVAELREENKELKVKLEEYASAMEKLQKDYDKLELEFKMLEHNYSSLKDMMVLEALKSGKKIRRNFKNPMLSSSRERAQHDSCKKERGNDKYVKEEPSHRSFERKETTSLTAQDRFPEFSTCTRNRYEKTSVKADYSENNVKENIPHHKTEHYDPLQVLAGSIKNRRKSMPAASAHSDPLSPDEDFERNMKTKDTRTDNRNLHKVSLDRHSNKIGESSHLDDRTYKYQGSSSRDMHKGRTSRYDTPPHRGRENYEAPPRYRKHPSPERVHKRLHRDYQDDYYRQEQRRYQGRSFESPPNSHSRHWQRLSDNRANYESNLMNKTSKGISMKTNKILLNIDNQVNVMNHSPRDRGQNILLILILISKKIGGIQRISLYVHNPCQLFLLMNMIAFVSPVSPQILCTWNQLFHIQLKVKNIMGSKIMAVAAIPLEDPRLSSLKYVVVKENGEDRLSTNVGLNVDLKPIDRSYYDVPPVNVPAALERRPSTDSFISDIYRGVDNPITNINTSFESGEVRETDNEYHDIYDRPKPSKYETQHKQDENDFSKHSQNVEKPVNQPSHDNYVIPKIGQNRNTSHNKDVPIKHSCETVSQSKNIQKKGAAEVSLPKKSFSSENKSEQQPASLPNNSSIQRENQSQVMLNKMAIVANDLELSDDTSDNVDVHKHVEQEKVEKSYKSLTNINKKEKESESLAPSFNVTTNPVDDVKTKNTPDDVNRELESVKKQKGKKSKGKSKSKDSPKDSAESLEAKCHSEKKVRSKKDKDIKPKKTKEKFSDLFGDSNSLVTPEDLGIPSYVPISEDAQDAVDININKAIDASPLRIDKEEVPLVQTQTPIEMKETTTVSNVLKEAESKENHKLPSPIVYENLNPGIDSNDTDVVKTVIISTGVQPGICNANTQVIRNPADHSMPTDVISKPTALEYKKHDVLKALATSTPQKEFTDKTSKETDDGTMDSASKSDVVKAVLTISNAEQVTKQNEVNSLDSQDAPDVRIFMKRRRKVIKRPPNAMT